MTAKSILTRDDYEAYLIRLYFGKRDSYLLDCMQRAYRDFNRTLHGLRALESRQELHTHAQLHLLKFFDNLETWPKSSWS